VWYELGFHISEDDVLHNHYREDLKFYIKLTDWVMQRRSKVLPVSYQLGFYIPEDGILHNRRENPNSYIETQ
jgi:hypothetical protein